jgi:hypothetical protein
MMLNYAGGKEKVYVLFEITRGRQAWFTWSILAMLLAPKTLCTQAYRSGSDAGK